MSDFQEILGDNFRPNYSVTKATQSKTSFDTRCKGEVAQLKILLEAAQRGFFCSKPTTEGCRYDLILDDGQKLHRVQCKYAGVEKDGMVRISLAKFSGAVKCGVPRRYYSSEIDVVMIYVANVNKILWLPPYVWEGKHAIHLRVVPAKNNQKKRVFAVDDFLW